VTGQIHAPAPKPKFTECCPLHAARSVHGPANRIECLAGPVLIKCRILDTPAHAARTHLGCKGSRRIPGVTPGHFRHDLVDFVHIHGQLRNMAGNRRHGHSADLPRSSVWRVLDLNQCRHTPAILQTAPFGRSGNPPRRFEPEAESNLKQDNSTGQVTRNPPIRHPLTCGDCLPSEHRLNLLE
jgi:hypothetical protein